MQGFAGFCRVLQGGREGAGEHLRGFDAGDVQRGHASCAQPLGQLRHLRPVPDAQAPQDVRLGSRRVPARSNNLYPQHSSRP